MKYFTHKWLPMATVALLCAVTASAQTFSIGEVVQPYEHDGIYHAKVNITNMTLTKQTLKVNAFLEGKQEDHLSYFCTGSLCYGPGMNEVTYQMAPNSTDSVVSYLEAQGVNGTSIIRYVFSNADNPDDKIEQTFTFVVGPTSVADLKNNVMVLSSPMPNPATGSTILHYSVPETATATIELYSTDSRLLKTFPINSSNGSLVIPTGEFPSGNYFYTLVVNGKKMTTNKLVIAH